MNHEDQFIPHLIVSDGMAALKFYKEVFGGEEGDIMMEPEGKRLMHGEIVLDGQLRLSTCSATASSSAGTPVG